MTSAPSASTRGTRTETIVSNLVRLIEASTLQPGVKLSSIRRAAEEAGVSKNTIVEAYDRLAAGGYIDSRPGSGFYVAQRTPTAPGERPRHVAEAIDIASLLSAQLEKNFSIRIGDGRPPASWMEESEVKRHLGISGRSNFAAEAGYETPMGFLPLREVLSSRLVSQDIHASPDQVLLTFGANHALDLVVRRFLSPGDTVLVDDPGYYPLFAKLKLAQVRIVGVRRTPTGPDPADLAAKAEAEKPKLFFTQSLAHNPTGSSINLPTAHAILTTALRFNFLVVEDDPFVDLPTVAKTRLSSLDQLETVISIGTFSKTLSASLRCGYVAAGAEIISSLAQLKMLTTVNSSGHVERLVFSVISNGHYRRHLKRLAGRIEEATSTVVTNLSQRGFSFFCPPTGGYYLYLLLPPGLDDIELGKAAAKEGMLIAPGSVFHSQKKAQPPAIRLNIAHANNPRFYDFLERARKD